MRIAIVFDGLGLGGIERVGVDYIKMLNTLGYQIDVYNLTPDKKHMEKELRNYCNIVDYKLGDRYCPELYSYGVKKWWWGKYVYPVIYAVLSIKILIQSFVYRHRKTEYEIVIAFSGHINDLTFVANNFLKSQKKLCWLHGSLAEYLLITPGFGALYKKIKNLNVLSNYADEAALSGNKFLMDLNINKIYNPTYIKKKEVKSEVVDKLKEKFGDYLLMVGRFTSQKDQATVVKAFKILKNQYKINNKLVFVGDGESKKDVESLVKKLGLEENIFFAGSQRNVQDYYKAGHLFIHSSPTEGFGLVILEAMNFGLPVVSTRSLPGIPEILGADEYGLTCMVGDEEEMAKKIYELLKDPTLYAHYSNQGKKRIKDFYPDIISNELQDILKMEDCIIKLAT